MYDVAIIGAGPSGIICAYELSNITNLKVVLIDAGSAFNNKSCPFISGNSCIHCTPCNTISGFGGAAFFNPGKLSLYPAGSGILNTVKSEQKCLEYYKRTIKILNRFGLNVPEYFDTMEIPGIFPAEGVKVKYYNSFPINKEQLNKFARTIELFLNDRIEVRYSSKVVQVKKTGNWEIQLENGENLPSKVLVVGTGEAGYRWWNRVANYLDVKRIDSGLDIGIRAEFPSEIIENVWKYHKDLKVLLKAPDGSELRTYCVLKNGITVPCFYGDYTVLDGIADYESDVAGMTIFNRINEKQLKTDKVSFADSYLGQFYSINSSPQRCTSKQFLETEIWEQYAFTEQIYNNLKFGLKRITEYLELDLLTNCTIHVPVIDNLWRKCVINQFFETSIKGLFVIGDSSGIARGILQSCVSGLAAAEGIKRGFFHHE